MRTQDEYSTPNRAQQVWSHFSGLFGADALKRKFGPSPPAEWADQLSYLTDAQVRRGFEVTMNAGSAHVPTLPEFVAYCRNAREFESGDAPQLEGPRTDRWGVEANNHLLAQVRAHAKYYSPDSTYEYDQKAGKHLAKSGPIGRARTEIVVRWKNAWADDMRADDKGAGISIAKQKAAWQDCMDRADAEIAALSQGKAA